jgi:antitoxin HigA-1
MGVSRLTVNQLVNDKRSVTAEMALRLAKVLNISPNFWLDLQRDANHFAARQAIAGELDEIPVLRKVA